MLKVENLTCQRNHTILFQGITLTLTHGKLLGVKGPNGSGKTTFLRAVCGLVPYTGTIETISCDQKSGKAHLRPFYFGYPFGIKKEFTANDCLQFWQGLFQKQLSSEFRTAFQIDTFLDQNVSTLSQGQKQRLALCQLDLTPSRLWCLDEPFDTLDPEGTHHLKNCIDAFLRQGGSLLLTSYYWPAALRADQTLSLE